nr:hypothetical protein [Rhodococcus opacus]
MVSLTPTARATARTPPWPSDRASVANAKRRCRSFRQANAKTLEGEQHPDRDVQFRYINEQVKTHQDAGEPVISVVVERSCARYPSTRTPSAERGTTPSNPPTPTPLRFPAATGNASAARPS